MISFSDPNLEIKIFMKTSMMKQGVNDNCLNLDGSVQSFWQAIVKADIEQIEGLDKLSSPGIERRNSICKILCGVSRHANIFIFS